MNDIFVFLADVLASWKQDAPQVITILYCLKECSLVYLQILNFFFILRFILAWFPNVNPFIPPYYIVIYCTEPILSYVEKRLPKIFGFDFTFLLCTIAIQQGIIILQKFKF